MKPDSAPETAFAGSLDEIVAALDRDPVLVEEVMGNGHTEEIREVLSQKAEDSPIPVHVVLTLPPPEITSTDPAEELLSTLHGRVDVDGVWMVGVGRLEVGVYADLVPDDEYDDTRLSSAVREALSDIQAEVDERCDDCSADSAALEAAVTMDVLANGLTEDWEEHGLTQDEIEGYATETWWTSGQGREEYVDTAEMPTSGTYAMVATVTLVCVTVVVYRLLQAIGGTRHPRIRGEQPPALPSRSELTEQLVAVRKSASAAHRSLARALERRKPSDDPESWRRRDIATACLERAETRLDSDDLLEVVGALVLAQTGSQALSKSSAQYRCCYVDPRHGKAVKESGLGGGLEVPVCRTCAANLAQQKPLDPLVDAGRFGSVKPYYERDSVWAQSGFGSLGGEWWQEVPR